MTNNETAAKITAAVSRRGSDARDVRDAAHEACHAFDCKLRGTWGRERLHAKLEKSCGDLGSMIYYEMRARAVEMIVCRAVDVDYDLGHWADVCRLETLKTTCVSLPSHAWVVEQIEKHAGRFQAKQMADKILALGKRSTK